jgi:hypothetical protein
MKRALFIGRALLCSLVAQFATWAGQLERVLRRTEAKRADESGPAATLPGPEPVSSGPPAHWVARVQHAAPQLLMPPPRMAQRTMPPPTRSSSSADPGPPRPRPQGSTMAPAANPFGMAGSVGPKPPSRVSPVPHAPAPTPSAATAPGLAKPKPAPRAPNPQRPLPHPTFNRFRSRVSQAGTPAIVAAFPRNAPVRSLDPRTSELPPPTPRVTQSTHGLHPEDNALPPASPLQRLSAQPATPPTTSPTIGKPHGWRRIVRWASSIEAKPHALALADAVRVKPTAMPDPSEGIAACDDSQSELVTMTRRVQREPRIDRQERSTSRSSLMTKNKGAASPGTTAADSAVAPWPELPGEAGRENPADPFAPTADAFDTWGAAEHRRALAREQEMRRWIA